jgi:hypothetical protein
MLPDARTLDQRAATPDRFTIEFGTVLQYLPMSYRSTVEFPCAQLFQHGHLIDASSASHDVDHRMDNPVPTQDDNHHPKRPEDGAPGGGMEPLEQSTEKRKSTFGHALVGMRMDLDHY